MKTLRELCSEAKPKVEPAQKLNEGMNDNKFKKKRKNKQQFDEDLQNKKSKPTNENAILSTFDSNIHQFDATSNESIQKQPLQQQLNDNLNNIQTLQCLFPENNYLNNYSYNRIQASSLNRHVSTNINNELTSGQLSGYVFNEDTVDGSPPFY